MAIGSHRLSQWGAITKRITTIEKMVGMDVLCSDKKGILTLNKLSIDINLIEVFAKDVDKEYVVLLATRASRTENKYAINVAILPLLGPLRHDNIETIRRALNLSFNVKMITGDQLVAGKEIGRRLGMGTNMYPSASLLGQDNDASIVALAMEELIEKAYNFFGIFPEYKYEIVKKLQERKHICGMTRDGVKGDHALKKADITAAVADDTDAARSAPDIVLIEPGLSIIISAVLTSRAIFQRMNNYTIYAVSITIRIVFELCLLLSSGSSIFHHPWF
ncbi:hypothetical protein F3Y22_tig00110744pilonHSYRG00035 [Hibiscus syriacus]|uniref:Plasma membrane ATPase n=1 Tax=Hibiscus syriacus TaxID=106335 RepID=A0A6A2ZUX1_HIBSY|nr:hypothetical protein F3Y22_tig00110744pilonHSYRG00035 [Hibiscus syriacus]